MRGRLSVVALLTLAMMTLATWPVLAQDTSTQTPSTEAENQDIAQTLEALRTLLQSTESRLEQVETRLDAQDERTSQLNDRVDDLQERVEGQVSILGQRVADHGAQIDRLQTAGILAALGLLAILVIGLILQSRRLRALEAVQDHVDRGVEEHDAEQPPQQ